ncbi:hypothetical protein BH10PSE6_BH10PSE6_51750 [soil metagenome]
MALLALWESNPTAVSKLRIEQIAVTAGDGHLIDDGPCSKELRSYFSAIDLENLKGHAERCLDFKFDKSGLVLQDIINEAGRRIGYDVINGRYQGTKSHNGCDGLWRSPEGKTIVVEVKTTDAYRIKLQKIMEYQNLLTQTGQISGPASALIVVGREDTGELEEQVRGSRYAWDIRLISVSALFKLAEVKQETDELETAKQIRTLLVPFDNTRLDGIVDVMFATTADVATPSEDVPTAQDGVEDDQREKRIATDPVAIAAKRDELLKALVVKYAVPLVKNTRATYWDPSHNIRAVCAISKPYPDYGEYRYWYAYHPAWDAFLSAGQTAVMAWACLDLDIAFVMPRKELMPLLGNMNVTSRANGTSYQHVKIMKKGSSYYLNLPLGDKDLSLEPYIVNLK